MIVTAKAGAKINLTLDIVGIREDGYHLVDMIMQSVSLFDTISVETTENGITVNSSDISLGGKDDICYKAAYAFYEKSGMCGGANITVKKSIPLAAGLGGGSADAAAVLMALNKCYDYPLSVAELEKIAITLGADVPFFLYGGTISVTGIGEIFEKLPDMPHCFIVIAKNAVKPSTKEMYRIIDSSVIYNRPDNSAAKKAISDGDLHALSNNIKNVFSVAWKQNDLVDILSSNNALAVSLSGSGPSYFGLYENENDAKAVVKELAKNGIPGFLTVPTNSSIFFD